MYCVYVFSPARARNAFLPRTHHDMSMLIQICGKLNKLNKNLELSNATCMIRHVCHIMFVISTYGFGRSTDWLKIFHVGRISISTVSSPAGNACSMLEMRVQNSVCMSASDPALVVCGRVASPSSRAASLQPPTSCSGSPSCAFLLLSFFCTSFWASSASGSSAVVACNVGGIGT
jgi:hypothetical protein